MNPEQIKKCSVVNELERWKCYQDVNFSNQQTIKAGYERVQPDIPNFNSYVIGLSVLVLSTIILIGINKIINKFKKR